MKKRIRYIFILMIICILGIISVQGFWLYNAWHIAYDQFGRSINGALGEAVGRKGFLDVKTFLQQHPSYNITPDSLHVRRSNTEEDRGYFYRRAIQRKKGIKSDHSQNEVEDTGRIEKNNMDSASGPMNPSWFFISERISENPYHLQPLDSLYHEELDSRGIKEAFTLDTLSANRQDFREKDFREKWREHTKLQTRKIKVNPTGDLFVQASFHTPYGYLFGKLIWILISSFLLLILITWCFIYMLRTILKQKRWSDIKNDFISNMTHELKTPIATVNAAIDALQHFSGMDDREKAKSYLDISHHELQRLSGLVEKVMQVSIEGNEASELHKERVNIISLIQTIISSHELKAGKEVHFQLKNTLEDPFIKVDQMHFSNTINNLIDNAIKYSGEKVNIEISLKKKGDQILLSIKDDGMGIPSQYRQLIFDKFFRVPTGDIHNVKGFGLGLSYVKNIIEKHEGTIQVKSEPGKGTEFIIMLPM